MYKYKQSLTNLLSEMKQEMNVLDEAIQAIDKVLSEKGRSIIHLPAINIHLNQSIIAPASYSYLLNDTTPVNVALNLAFEKMAGIISLFMHGQPIPKFIDNPADVEKVGSIFEELAEKWYYSVSKKCDNFSILKAAFFYNTDNK